MTKTTEERRAQRAAEYRRPGNQAKAAAKGKIYRATHKRAISDAHRRSHAMRVARYQQLVSAAMVGGCVDCGITERVVLEFDHVRGEKTTHVARMRNWGAARILAEIAKCEVRCANCHRRITAKRLRERAS